MALRFFWDARKAAANLKKHAVGFPEATTIFDDALSMTIPDPEHSVGQERFLLLGMSSRRWLLVVAHIEHGDAIRIISVRRANGRERRDYEEGT